MNKTNPQSIGDLLQHLSKKYSIVTADSSRVIEYQKEEISQSNKISHIGRKCQEYKDVKENKLSFPEAKNNL